MGELVGIARFTFHEGKVDEFKRLSAQVMGIVRTMDKGTLRYDIYFNHDESECIVVEQYKDSAAMTEHAQHVGHLMPAVFATARVTSDMLGDPSAEVRAQMAGGEVRLFTPYLSL